MVSADIKGNIKTRERVKKEKRNSIRNGLIQMNADVSKWSDFVLFVCVFVLWLMITWEV